MSCCSHCQDAGTFFNRRTAERELRRYLRKGPNKSTRHLLDEIRNDDLHGLSLLDIGGGIGAITFELMKEGIVRSLQVDASTAYLNIARSEAEKRGLTDRIRYMYGDFTSIADEIPASDIVTLDRVICCYPDMPKLVGSSAEKAIRYYGVVYPRKLWPVRFGIKIGNLYFKLRGSTFRTYLHDPEIIDRHICGHGFRRIRMMHTFLWESVLYVRD
jgi:SAM-dependent methyltransferase